MSTAKQVSRYWPLYILLAAAPALSFLDRQVLSVLAPQITAEFGLSNEGYGRVLFAFVLSYTVMAAFGGRLMDFLGSRVGFAAAVAVWSIASAAHAGVRGLWSLATARFALGVGEGPCFPVATKCALEWVPPRDRAFAVGLSSGGAAFGAVVAPPLTAWCAVLLGWRATFLAVSSLGFLWVVAWLVLVRRRPDFVSAPSPAAAGWGRVLRRPGVARLALSRFITDPVLYFYMFWIPQYLYQERHLSILRIGALTWIPYVVMGFSGIGAGRLSDALIARGGSPRRTRLGVMLAGALLTPVSCFVVHAGSVGLAIGLMSAYMLAHGLWMTNLMTLVGEAVPAGEVATAAGLVVAVGGLSGMLSNLGIGWVVDHFHFAPVFFTIGILYPLAWILVAAGRSAPSPAPAPA